MIALLLLSAASPACTDVERQCRACTTRDGRQVCSTIGIACQPRIRICKPAERSAKPVRKTAK